MAKWEEVESLWRDHIIEVMNASYYAKNKASYAKKMRSLWPDASLAYEDIEEITQMSDDEGKPYLGLFLLDKKSKKMSDAPSYISKKIDGRGEKSELENLFD